MCVGSRDTKFFRGAINEVTSRYAQDLDCNFSQKNFLHNNFVYDFHVILIRKCLCKEISCFVAIGFVVIYYFRYY